MKNSGDHGVANYAITKIDLLAGHRESRRLIGDYIVNENDVRSGTLFPDRVAYAGWPIDVHPPGGIYDKEPPCTHVYLPHFWSIPFRCLYSKNIPNLLFAGRNISASHVALGSCRVMATCAAEGQAVGTAAALCSREKLTPRQLGQNKIHLLQQQLLKDDCYLIGIKNEDPADAALQATISSSSQAVLEPALPEDFQELDNPCAQMFPVSQDRINMVELYLTSTLLQPVIIPMGLRAAQDINDFKSGEDIGQGHQTIEPGFEGWLRFDLDMSVLPGRFYWIHLPAVPGVKWAAGKGLTFGTNRAVYQAKKWPQWRAFARTPFSEPFLRTFCFRLTPESKPYGPANIISGVTRPETQTNIWISNPLEKLPQWINFNFDHPISLSKMHVTLDDDLDANIYHPTPYGRLGRGVPETLLSEYRLLAKVQNSWRPVLHMIHNHQRRRIHRFDPIHTQKLRFEALATHGAPEARVYEIRFYGK